MYIMYLKNYIIILISSILCAISLAMTKEYMVYGQDNSANMTSAISLEKEIKLLLNIDTIQTITEEVKINPVTSNKRIVYYENIKSHFIIDVTKKDIETLLKIVEAEAGGEDRKGKILVANVIINRVKNGKFPDTVTDVVYEQNYGVSQFSPVADGRIDKVKVSDETKEAVYSALRGEDISSGALYFMAREYSSPENVAWFDTSLQYLFTHGEHDFFIE